MLKLLLLQGLIPRATSLAQLGGSFFLAFLPAVLVISLLFSAIYFVSLLLSSIVQCSKCLTRLAWRQGHVFQSYNWHDVYALCVWIQASCHQFRVCKNASFMIPSVARLNKSCDCAGLWTGFHTRR